MLGVGYNGSRSVSCACPSLGHFQERFSPIRICTISKTVVGRFVHLPDVFVVLTSLLVLEKYQTCMISEPLRTEVLNLFELNFTSL